MSKIQPKISINKSHIAAVKQFTDRTGYIDTFWNTINRLNQDDFRVLVYYGVGGIGKTSLRKKLQLEIDRKDYKIIWSALDFEIKQHRNVDNALMFLRTELSKKHKIGFTLFDFAYTYYLKKTSPQTPLNEQSLPFLEEGSLIADIINTFNDMPLLGVPTKIAMLLSKGHKLYKDWTTQKRIEDIVDMSLKEPKELLEYLPVYFAEDLKSYLKNRNQKSVIFLDTYEALRSENKDEKTFFEVDEWIRDVLIPSLPGVLFVILGREKLKWQGINSSWNDYLDQHLIGTLAEEDSKLFLKSAGIKNTDIIESIIEISQGHPYSLDLCVDTYEAIIRERVPLKEDFNFDTNKTQIFERFIKYLQISERETLKVLSVPRFWNYEIFELLIREFNTGYPISALDDLNNFSFVSERVIESSWEMHSLMRKSLSEYQGKEQSLRIHKFMFNYYSNEFNDINNKNLEICLNEGYYHGINCLDTEDFCYWFINNSNRFIKMGNILFLVSLFEELIRSLTEPFKYTSLFSKLSYKLARIYITLGNNNKAYEILNSSKQYGDKIDKTFIISLLALLSKNTYNYKNAEEYFEEALKNYEDMGNNNFYTINSINKIKLLIEYGKLKVYLSENHEALKIYNNVILQIDNLLKKEIEINTLLNCRAVVYEKLGEVNSVMGNFGISEELYKKAIESYNKIIDEELYGEENSDLIYYLNNKGMIYKRLAEYYVNLNQIELAKHNYRKALQTYENSREKFSENVDTYKKIGFAARGLLRQLVRENSDMDEIKLAYEKCLNAFKKAIELSPKDVSAIHSMGGADMILGKYYENKSNYNKALELFDIAIEHSIKANGIQPDYLYAYDGKAEILINKAEIFTKLGNLDIALSLYDEGLSAINEVLDKTPKALYAINKKEVIVNKMRQLNAKHC